MTTVIGADKLRIRSKVVSTLTRSKLADLGKKDRRLIITTLADIPERRLVLETLAGELRRYKPQISAEEAAASDYLPQPCPLLSLLTETLLELGNYPDLEHPLWAIIERPDCLDEVKEVAHLILRHFGETRDPEDFLNQLSDPIDTAARETELILEYGRENPEALVDLLDFWSSLQPDDQHQFLDGLIADYDPARMVNLLLAIGDTDPASIDLQLHILPILAASRSPVAYGYLARRLEMAEPAMVKPLKRALQELRFSGADRRSAEITGWLAGCKKLEAMATLPDGLGSQAWVIRCQKENGDLCVVCFATNDRRGVLDGFGFYELTDDEFSQMALRMQQAPDSEQLLPVPYEYLMQQLIEAEKRAYTQLAGLPYEYTCWRLLFEGFIPTGRQAKAPKPCSKLETFTSGPKDWQKEDASDALWSSPLLATWHLEVEDILDLEALFEKTAALFVTGENILDGFNELVEQFVSHLQGIGWHGRLAKRLHVAAALLSFGNKAKTAQQCKLVAQALEDWVAGNAPSALARHFLETYVRRSLYQHALPNTDW